MRPLFFLSFFTFFSHNDNIFRDDIFKGGSVTERLVIMFNSIDLI